jgi:hypothetical protein
MPTFIVYVEFYEKKLKVQVDAENEFRADNLVRSKLRIVKVLKKEAEDKKTAMQNDSGSDFLKGLFGF